MYNYSIENEVNEWITENSRKIEITRITQSSCCRTDGSIYVTVMIEYFEIV
jgi:hypothetical protein